MLAGLKIWARRVKRDVFALYLAARDPRVPWYAKAMAALVAAYALSPIDLIPDFIPVLGHLDDLILVPLGVLAAARMVPPEVMADLRRQAEQRLKERPSSPAGAVLVILIWSAVLAGVVWVILAR